MSRDHRKLRVFELADELVGPIYRCTQVFPVEERYGLQAQIRRAAVSVPTNIVEGCARRSTKDYLYFLGVAMGSASEVRYLLTLAGRLEFLPAAEGESLQQRYDDLVRGLQALISSLAQGP